MYMNICPGTTVLRLCTFEMARSLPDAGAEMVVGSVAVLLPALDIAAA